MQGVLLISITVYFLILFGVSFLTGKDTRNSTFFMAQRKSPWYVVAFGMLGASMSGITFISVPGKVILSDFTYLQMVMGFIFGYLIIAWVLLPLYYKLQVTSIYSYLNIRFGNKAYKTGAVYFLISKTLASAPILYVLVAIIQNTISNYYNLPFFVTVVIVVALIWLYTYRTGLKTIVWTDVLQTFFMLLAVMLTIGAVCTSLHWNYKDAWMHVMSDSHAQIFNFSDVKSGNYFWKLFLAGVFIPIVMTGLDQDKMQKNLTCKTLREAQKNVVTSGIAFTPVNFLFLFLGVLLVFFSQAHGIALPEKTDTLFPSLISSGLLPHYIGVVFILGLVAATYSSADSALASMTTCFCVDILELNEDTAQNKKKRFVVHLAMSILMVLAVMGIELLNIGTMLDALYRIVSYTYGPLLGLFAFGLFTRIKTRDGAVPYIATASILLSFLLEYSLMHYFHYRVGYELLIVNGVITFAGLYAFKIYKIKQL